MANVIRVVSQKSAANTDNNNPYPPVSKAVYEARINVVIFLVSFAGSIIFCALLLLAVIYVVMRLQDNNVKKRRSLIPSGIKNDNTSNEPGLLRKALRINETLSRDQDFGRGDTNSGRMNEMENLNNIMQKYRADNDVNINASDVAFKGTKTLGDKKGNDKKENTNNVHFNYDNNVPCRVQQSIDSGHAGMDGDNLSNAFTTSCSLNISEPDNGDKSSLNIQKRKDDRRINRQYLQ